MWREIQALCSIPFSLHALSALSVSFRLSLRLGTFRLFQEKSDRAQYPVSHVFRHPRIISHVFRLPCIISHSLRHLAYLSPPSYQRGKEGEREGGKSESRVSSLPSLQRHPSVSHVTCLQRQPSVYPSPTSPVSNIIRLQHHPSVSNVTRLQHHPSVSTVSPTSPIRLA